MGKIKGFILNRKQYDKIHKLCYPILNLPYIDKYKNSAKSVGKCTKIIENNTIICSLSLKCVV